jgi:hypothetical protein
VENPYYNSGESDPHAYRDRHRVRSVYPSY